MSLPFVAYAQSPAWSRFVLPLVALPRYIWSWLTRAEKLQQNIRGLKSSNARMFDSSSIEGPSTESRRAVDKFLKNFKADFGQRKERRGDSERGRQGKHAMPRGIFRLGNCDPSASFFPSWSVCSSILQSLLYWFPYQHQNSRAEVNFVFL